MKKILASAAVIFLAASPLAHAAPQGEQKTLLQMLFPPSENYFGLTSHVFTAQGARDVFLKWEN